jgi:hypothetical protein
MRGWKYDSYRHSLAARGINTRYYVKKSREFRGDIVDDSGDSAAQGKEELYKRKPSRYRGNQPRSPFEVFRQQTTPQTGATRTKGISQFKKVTEEYVRGERSVNKALESLREGNPADVIDLLQKGTKDSAERPKKGQPVAQIPLSFGEKAALKTALAAQALKYAQSGNSIPTSIIEQLDKDDADRILNIQQGVATSLEAQAKEATESPLSRELKKDLPILAGQIADAPAEGLSGVGFLGGGGIKSPLEGTTNVLAGPPSGAASPFGQFPGGKVPNLSSAFDFAGAGTGTNPILAKTPPELRRKAEIVQDQVDSLYKNRDELSKVDLSAYEKGNEAFEKGNREKLIDAISSLQTEESKLRDRWNLVGQTHRNVESIENHTSAFQKASDSNPLWGIGKQGGKQLADQTDKLNKVREGIVKANNQVFGRKRMLQFRLQRLDSTVPPETSVPQTVKRFEQPKGIFKNIDNPVLDNLKRGSFQ